jgi:hypothetical protein
MSRKAYTGKVAGHVAEEAAKVGVLQTVLTL